MKRIRSILSELCPSPTLAFCMDKHIVGVIMFHKHISSSYLLLTSFFWSLKRAMLHDCSISGYLHLYFFMLGHATSILTFLSGQVISSYFVSFHVHCDVLVYKDWLYYMYFISIHSNVFVLVHLVMYLCMASHHLVVLYPYSLIYKIICCNKPKNVHNTG